MSTTSNKPPSKPRNSPRKPAAKAVAEPAVIVANVPAQALGQDILGTVERVAANPIEPLPPIEQAGSVELPFALAPRPAPLDLLRASPWLFLAIACLVPLFFLVGGTFTELLLWPVAKTALIVFLVYWADRTLHRSARLHWYSLALLPAREGEEAEIRYLRERVPVGSLVWLAIGAWIRRGLMLGALILVFAKAY